MNKIKNRSWIVILVGLIVIIFVGKKLWHEGRSLEIFDLGEPKIAPGQPQGTVAKKRELMRSQELLGQSIKDLSSGRPGDNGRHLSQERRVFPEACQARFEKMASLSLADLYHEIEMGGLTSDKNCEEHETTQLARQSIKINMGQCFALMAQMVGEKPLDSHQAQNKSDPKLQDCQSAILFLRAAIIDQLFPDSPRENLSPEVLANKILVQLGTALASEDDRKRVLSLAEELASKEPNLYASHKAIAILRLFEPGKDGKIDPDNPKFLEALAVCKEFEVNDPELEEVAFFRLAAADNLDEVSSVARRTLEENPKSSAAYYFLASDFFKKGNREEAIRLLTLANNYSPNDDRIKDTLLKAKTAKPTEKIFSSRMSLSFSDESL